MRLEVLVVILLDPLDFPAGTEDERYPLVQPVGGQSHHPLVAGAGQAAGLLDEERDRVDLVQ
jgi:hypothetical protein